MESRKVFLSTKASSNFYDGFLVFKLVCLKNELQHYFHFYTAFEWRSGCPSLSCSAAVLSPLPSPSQEGSPPTLTPSPTLPPHTLTLLTPSPAQTTPLCCATAATTHSPGNTVQLMEGSWKEL